MRLFSLNIEGSRHLHRWIPQVVQYEADVVCLQEVFRDDLPFLCHALGMRALFREQEFVVGSLASRLGRLGGLGVAILSRQKLFNPRFELYQDEGTRGLLSAEVAVDGRRLRVATLHFTWSCDGKNTLEQAKHLNRLLEISEAYPRIVMVGDFNIPRGTPLYRRLVKPFISWVPLKERSTIDPRLHRMLGLELVVDHLLSTPDISCREVSLQSGLSDHRAVLASIGLAQSFPEFRAA